MNNLLDLSFFIPINVITIQFSGLILKVQHAGVLPVTEAMGVLGLWTLMEPAVPVRVLVTQGAGCEHLHLAQPGCQGVQGQAGECRPSHPPAGALPQELQAALLQVGVVQ